MLKRIKAEITNGRALNLQKQGKLQKAIELFKEAAAGDPGWSAPMYNLGLLYKKQRQWEESLEWNQRATAIDPKNEGAWWNLGIAATALGRWQVARSAWRGFGIDVPDALLQGATGPVDLPCGFGPIRLNPDGDAEVVWADRIDPARAVLASIPFPETNHRWKDVVLNDGEPDGYRKYQGKEVPVLNALALLEKSPFGTYVAHARVPARREPNVKLAELAAAMDGSAEDWSTSVRILCKACSEGRPHRAHDTAAAPPEGVHTIGIAARNRHHAEEMLRAWEAASKGIRIESLDVGLAALPSNGK